MAIWMDVEWSWRLIPLDVEVVYGWWYLDIVRCMGRSVIKMIPLQSIFALLLWGLFFPLQVVGDKQVAVSGPDGDGLS